MADLKDIVAYILINYPHKDELSNARVTKMVYLSDWKCALEFGSQVSSIDWVFDYYGPFVHDIIDTARKYDDLFSVTHTANAFGGDKKLLSCVNTSYKPQLSTNERTVIDHTIEKTKQLTWESFIGLVYSTYPIVSSERHTHLDLIRDAEAYKKTGLYKSVSPS